MQILSPEWGTVKKFLETEIERLRKQNDSVELSDTQTAAIRGEIRALKRVLDLPQKQAQDSLIRAQHVAGLD